MDFEELQNAWDNLNKNPEENNTISRQDIEQATSLRYRGAMKKIVYPELLGSAVCLLSAGVVVLMFDKLDSGILKAVGVATILILIALAALSWVSIRKLKSDTDFNKPHNEMLREFANKEITFIRWQKINMILCYALLVGVIVILPKISSGKDISSGSGFWIFSFSFGYIFLTLLSRWVSRHYGKTLLEAKELLRELA